jgi:hypothetical protein
LKKIQATYCFPVLPSDMLKDEVKIGNFARDFWGQGEHASFAQILKGSMASMPGCGRGQGRGFQEEDQWSDQGWWNHGYPPPQEYPLPPFHAPYGFYPPPPLPDLPPMGMPFQGPHPGRSYQQPQVEQRSRQNLNQGARPRGPAPKQKVEANKGNDQA